uniref:Reverse transcriptase n=1 Tax=Nelumbo nucifera TaxID=4432 RepID=A0A822YXV7_NELNU|nr:TPA_asm: hypothetical protein HUJ06_013226 [Nelumbo nucifera]
MICLSWNYVIFLIETLVHVNKIEEIRIQVGFAGAFAVDREGRGGGIAFLWKAPNMCSLLDYSNNHINVQVCDDEKGPWRLTSFYGYPDRSRRRDSWNLLRAICASSRLPWCCIGDFNDMLSLEDKRGRLDHPNWLLAGFHETISDCHLHEISIIERIDRAFASGEWLGLFSDAKLQNLVAPISDHNPILLETVSVSRVHRQLHFRFENGWLWEPGLNKMVEDAWSLLRMGDKFTRDIAQCKAVIERLRDNNIPSDIETIKEKKIELLKLLGQEEDYWYQRSNSFWLRDGDANTKYFHTAASTRKRTNRISRLMDDEGNWHDDPSSLCQVVQDYFRKLFSLSSSHAIDGFDFVDCKVLDSENEKLLSPFSFEEFKESVFQMHPNKSLSPDGLNPAFYQKFRPLIGKDIFQAAVSWLSRKEFPVLLNDTTIVLILKCESPKTMKDLRPISLCNVLYKIISKVLANRLKVLLPNIISNAQFAFMLGRAIIDNVLVAFELIHFMRRKNWVFSDKWIRLIMLCVTTVSYSVAFNGMEVGPIILGRGLRQGDPLSPYLFILCLISGCRICRDAPSVSHLLFADDSFFFFKVEEMECNAMKNILKVYEEASGQAINFQKYLGLPSLIGRKKEVFRFIRDHLWQRLQGWKSKLLSRAGKEILIKSVAQDVPSYYMSTFMIPDSLNKELERMMNSFWWGNSNSNDGGIKWLRWEKFCVRKEEGGIGFRDMQAFNLAMLAKQGWNILSNPDALVCRVLKAKYFPRGDFLAAQCGHNSSYTWKSIWHSRIVLEKGCRWRIGNGQHIRVWDDLWLKEIGNFKADSPRVEGLEDIVVSDLWIPGHMEWDVEMIHELFGPRDAIKSGYRVARDLNTTISQAVILGGWDKLWKLPIPPKVKSFVWQVCREYTSCHLCNTNVESLSHVLLSCPYAQACWSKAGISVNVLNHASFANCLLEFLAEIDFDKSRCACMVLWTICSQRNSKLWRNNFKLLNHAITGSLQLLHDWKQAQIQKRLGMVINLNHQGDDNWHAPPPGSFKCNVDAASFTSSNLTGFGIVIRDEIGAFVKGYPSIVPGLFISKEGEVMALIAAIKWVISMDIQNVEFETDALVVWKALRAVRIWLPRS